MERREDVIGNSGTGKAHVALRLGLTACQSGASVNFTTTAALVHELMEARDEIQPFNLQPLPRLSLLIIDELGLVPLSRTVRNCPSSSRPRLFGSERLTGALLDRLAHHMYILVMNGESYRFKDGRHPAVAPYPGELAEAEITPPSGSTPCHTLDSRPCR